MEISHLTQDTSKDQVQTIVQTAISQAGLSIVEANFDKPWGGYFVIDEQNIKNFVSTYFSDIATELLYQVGQGFKLTPKVLVVAPKARLSWQYHFRRSEEWTVVSHDPVGVMMSATDEQPTQNQIFTTNQRITLGVQERHRLIGLDNWGVVAEVWCHTEPSTPSDEADIVRVQDDYQRA